MNRLNLLSCTTALTAAVGAVGLGSPGARADTIVNETAVWYPGTGSGTYGAPSGDTSSAPPNGMQRTGWTTATGSGAQQVSVPKILVPHGENLQSMTITLYAQIDSTVYADNTNNSSDATFGTPTSPFTLELQISALKPGSIASGGTKATPHSKWTGSDVITDAVVSAAPNMFTPIQTTLLAGQSKTLLGSTVNATASTTVTYTAASVLALFEGSGNTLVPLTTSSVRSGASVDASSTTISFTTYAAGGIQLSYDLTIPVAEPASLAAIGTALVGLGVARRRRRKV